MRLDDALSKRGGTMLDIGAGAGFALVHYATRFPGARVVGLEVDAPSVNITRHAIIEATLTERIEIRHGDADSLKDEKVFDLVTMNIALHETGGPAEYRNVLSRIYRALKPSGTVVVSELPYPESPQAYRDEAVCRLLAGLQLHEALVGCGMITQEQLRELLEGTGFAHVRVAKQPLLTRVVMVGEKPD